MFLDVGARGISVKKLAKHVYNHYCTLFYQPDFSDVYRQTQQYVRRHTGTPQSLLERTERWGHYRLNTDAQAAFGQGQLRFAGDEPGDDDDEPQRPGVDLSLDLFEGQLS